jgi:hypothetical protein
MSKFLNTVRLASATVANFLKLVAGSALTAERTLTLTTGDADRTLTLTGDASISGMNTGDQSLAGYQPVDADLTAIAALNSTGFARQATAGTWSIVGETGSSNVVRATSPTLVTPILGTPTSGTLSNCDAFGGAGGAASKGVVPSPGATAHASHPYYLGDNAAFHQPKGYVLGKAALTTGQTTTSATAVGLAGAVTFNVTLDVAMDLMVDCTCIGAINTATQTVRLYVEEDTTGSAVATAISLATIPTNNGGVSLSGRYLLLAVAAGTYTFTQKYSVSGGVTATFSFRCMEVRIA